MSFALLWTSGKHEGKVVQTAVLADFGLQRLDCKEKIRRLFSHLRSIEKLLSEGHKTHTPTRPWMLVFDDSE